MQAWAALSRSRVHARSSLCAATLCLHYQKYSTRVPFEQTEPHEKRRWVDTAVDHLEHGMKMERFIGAEGKRLGLGLQLRCVRAEAHHHTGRLLAAQADLKAAAAYKVRLARMDARDVIASNAQRVQHE